MLKLEYTYKLELHPHGGVTVNQAARDAYLLSSALGVRVDVIHNARTYTVDLEVREQKQLEVREQKPNDKRRDASEG